MGVLRDKSGSCFCSGGGKSERIKGGIFSGKSPAMSSISAAADGGGTGFLIHQNLLLTTQANIPSPAAAEAAEGHQLQYLKTSCNLSLDHGSIVYLLGHTQTKELMVSEGKVVIATDNLIKLSIDGVTWSPGSAGFDAQGNLVFMVCDPMKLATSPTAKFSSASAFSSSSLSWKKDSPMQFGIPIPIIRDWLHQHWEGNLDELSKPKLPRIRLMSSGQKSEHSCASFTQHHIFKPTGENNDFSSSSQIASLLRFQVWIEQLNQCKYIP